MRVTQDREGGFWSIAALTREEDELLRPFVERLQRPDTSFTYCGRITEPDGKFLKVIVNAGGAKREKTEKFHNLTVTQDVVEDGVTVTLEGTSEDDKHALFSLRDCFFWGALKPVLIKDSVATEGFVSFRIAGKPCKHCGAPLVTMGRCEWSTCEACAAKCAHVYERGAVHGGSADIAMGEFCKLCGSVKPRDESERVPSVLEQHRAVERELGVQVIYRDGPAPTPQATIALDRLTRRLGRSKVRASKRKRP